MSSVAAGAPDGRRDLARYFRLAAGILAFFLLAEFVTRLEIVPPIYLPYASTVVRKMAALLGDPVFLGHVGSTLYAWAIGLSIACVIGIALGILVGASDLAHRMSSSIIEFMRPIPSVAIIPLGMILWGQGLAMKVILVAYATLWPILYNTIYGVHDVDPVAMQTVHAFGLGRWAALRRITLPSAAPLIFTGIRVSASMGLIVVVGAELLASADRGIGSFIIFASSGGGQMDTVLAGAAIGGLLGLLINGLLTALDRRLFGWRYLGAAPQ
jgi:NitT/TauT family transport system permease protein